MIWESGLISPKARHARKVLTFVFNADELAGRISSGPRLPEAK